MMLIVVAHRQSEYAAWAKDAVAQADLLLDPATQVGREKFLSLACAGCHTVKGTPANGKVGPELTHIAKDPNHKLPGSVGTVNAQNLHRWIKDPQKEKPGTLMPTLGLDDQTIDQIVN